MNARNPRSESALRAAANCEQKIMNRPKIDDAVVQIPSMGGRGVLIGEIIVTAAHCVSFKTDGSMILGDYIIEEVETRCGERIKVTPLAVEPVADIAVLGCLDAQEFPDEAKAFGEYCKVTSPFPLARRRIPCGKPVAIRVLNADGKWTDGEAELCDESGPYIWIEAQSEIIGGASGGPILNHHEELIAIVSNSSVPTPGLKSTGRCPYLLNVLPQWICAKYLCYLTKSQAKD